MSVRAVMTALVLGTALPPYRPTALAQTPSPRPVTIAGRLLRVREADTSALAGQWIVAHRISERAQGPIDSMQTDGGGRFRFVISRPDSGDVYVVSSRHQGIGYFSEPATSSGAPPAPLVLVVFDTSVTGQPLEVGIRHVVVTRGDAGARRVLDIFQVSNPARSTRVGRDSSVAVWSSRLPDGVESPEPGEGDVTASALRFANGRVEVLAPFPPGLKQVVITYTLPADRSRLVIPVDHPTERLEVLLEDSTATVSADLGPEEPVAIEGRSFRRYSADSLAAGAAPAVSLSAQAAPPRDWTWLVVTGVALALTATGLYARARRASAADRPVAAGAEAPRAGDPELAGESDARLAAMIAALDDRFATRQADTPAEAWTGYQRRRAALRAELERRVARG